MKKDCLGILAIAAVLTASLICGAALFAAAGNSVAGRPFSSTLAVVLLKVDSDSDSESTPLAPIPSIDNLKPEFAGILPCARLRPHAATPQYSIVQPRSPPRGALSRS